MMKNSQILLTDAEMTRLKNTKTEQEWSDACDAVKAARGGAYPEDWFVKVLASGLMSRVQANWVG